MTSRSARIEAALIGAYVADAAALGFHWLYDPGRLAQLAGNDAAFREPDASDFEGYKGVFVHPTKRAGDLSQYGHQLRVAIQSMIRTQGAFDIADFQDSFAAAFGSGGSWVGYMDKATKGTLANLAADQRDPSGFDDDQVPAIARLPAVMVQSGLGTDQIDAVTRVTSNNTIAVEWSRPCAAVLNAVYDGANIMDALKAGIAASTPEIATALTAAINSDQPDSVAFAGQVGRACPLPQSLPVMYHIAARATSFQDAIDRNIRAAGDNCGRAPVLGAWFGAAHGVTGNGVPLHWIGRVHDIAELTAEISQLVAMLDD